MRNPKSASVFILTVLFLTSVVSGCDKRRPEGVPSDNEMVSLMADLEIAEGYMQTQNRGYYGDSVRLRVLQYLLDRHGMTKADFDTTMSWYGRNIDDYRELYARVDAELARRQKQMTGSDQNVISNDLWTFPRHLALTEASTSDGFTFSIPSADIEKGERLSWKFNINRMVPGQVVLGVDYEDGSTTYLSQTTPGDRNIDILLQTDTAKRISRIYGNYRISETRDLPVWVDSVRLASLPFDSTEYYKIHSHRYYRGPQRKKFAKPDSIYVVKDSETESDAKEESRKKLQGGNKIRPKGAVKGLKPIENKRVVGDRRLQKER